LFVLVAAVTAAVLLDPVLEMLSNAGVFGPGHFTDNSTADVLPAALASLLLAVAFVALTARRRWLRESIGHLSGRAVLKLLPVIAAVQLAIVFSMETIEQILVLGHPLGGTVWLGAPTPIALLVHIAGGALLAGILARALQAFASHVVRAVRRIASAFASRRPRLPARCSRPLDAVFVRTVAPVIRRVAGRAPPFPSVV
jgi:hypothetical protein